MNMRYLSAAKAYGSVGGDAGSTAANPQLLTANAQHLATTADIYDARSRAAGLAMNMQYQSAAKAYGSVGIETGVPSANPHHLILMLFDGAISSLQNAQGHMRARRIAEKGMAITKAIRILDEGLKASLDPAGGEIAAQLSDLYDFMVLHLVKANMNNSVEAVAEVLGILQGLRDAWFAIGQPGKPPAGPTSAWPAPMQKAAA